MARMTLLFGLLLVLVGIWGYVESGNQSSAALVPAGFGIVLGVLGSTARSGNAKTRMLVMHIAVTVGLIGFLISASHLWDYYQIQRGNFVGNKLAAECGAAMAVITLFFVLLCVRSFIQARRTGKAS